jgi:hypothetical protein
MNKSPEIQDWKHSLSLEYWWSTCHFKNTYSPITLTNLSSIYLVLILRCSSPTHKKDKSFSSYQETNYRDMSSYKSLRVPSQGMFFHCRDLLLFLFWVLYQTQHHWPITRPPPLTLFFQFHTLVFRLPITPHDLISFLESDIFDVYARVIHVWKLNWIVNLYKTD